MSLRLIAWAVIGAAVVVTVDPVVAQQPPKPGMMTRMKSWFRSPFKKDDGAFTSVDETDRGFLRTRVSKTPSPYAQSQGAGGPANRMQSSIHPGNGPLPQAGSAHRDPYGNLKTMSPSSGYERTLSRASEMSRADESLNRYGAATTSRSLPRGEASGRGEAGYAQPPSPRMPARRMADEDRYASRGGYDDRGGDDYARGAAMRQDSGRVAFGARDSYGRDDEGYGRANQATDRNVARSYGGEPRGPYGDAGDMRGYGRYASESNGPDAVGRDPRAEALARGGETENPFERHQARREMPRGYDSAPPQRAMIPEEYSASDAGFEPDAAAAGFRQAGYDRPAAPARRATGFDYPTSDIGTVAPQSGAGAGQSTYFSRDPSRDSGRPVADERAAAFDRAYNSRRPSYEETPPASNDWGREEAARYGRSAEFDRGTGFERSGGFDRGGAERSGAEVRGYGAGGGGRGW